MPTIRDVATKANVSATTVSFVLNGRQPAGGPISEDTRLRVVSAAKELGYRRNALAQAVFSGENKALGFLAANPENWFMAHVLGGILDVTEEAGYSAQILRLKGTSLNRQVIERCLELRLAGILAVDLDEDALDYLCVEMQPLQIPVAFIDTSYSRDRGIHVATDDVQGCRLAMEHLFELGHRKIGFIGGKPGRGMAGVREHAYRSLMQEQGLEIEAGWVQYGNWWIPGAKEVALKMLTAPNRPTAIFCASDEMAVAAQTVARDLGLKMPEELSVVGFANIELGEMSCPPLTTIAQSVATLGRVAARVVLERIEGVKAGNMTSDEPVEHLVPTHLVIRDSTAPPQF